jgi:hypothetical protein
MVYEGVLKVKLQNEATWTTAWAKISPLYSGIVFEFQPNDKSTTPVASAVPRVSTVGLAQAPNQLLRKAGDGLGPRTRIERNAVAEKTLPTEIKTIRLVGLQSICTTQARTQDELKLVFGDGVVLIRTPDRNTRDELLQQVATLELSRSIMNTTGCIVGDKLWPQDRRLLLSSKVPIPVNSELVNEKRMERCEQTYDGLMSLQRNAIHSVRKVLQEIHTIHMIQEAVHEHDEGGV